MKKSLTESINENTAPEAVRFYVPGHKGRSIFLSEACRRDVTELDFTDDLNVPKGAFREAEKDISALYKSRFSILTVNGSTAAVMTAVGSCVRDGETLLVPSDAHVSVYFGAMHAGARILRYRVRDHLRGVTPEDVKEALSGEGKDAAALVITTPTYFGNAADVEAISGLARKAGIKLIADEAHGAHLVFMSRENLSAIGKADYVIHSMHKSLGALTQTAVLHVYDPEADEAAVRLRMRSFQSTSPSFLLSSSMTEVIAGLKNGSGLFDKIDIWYNDMIKHISKLKLFETVDFGPSADPMRITLLCRTDMKRLTALFRIRHIEEEMTMGNLMVLYMGAGTSESDITALKKALDEAEETLPFVGTPVPGLSVYLPKTSEDMRTAIAEKSEYVALSEATGRISTDMVCVYPPGAPCLIPGSLIDGEAVRYISEAEDIQGVYDGKLRVKA